MEQKDCEGKRSKEREILLKECHLLIQDTVNCANRILTSQVINSEDYIGGYL
jgi:hypothetical protein